MAEQGYVSTYLRKLQEELASPYLDPYQVKAPAQRNVVYGAQQPAAAAPGNYTSYNQLAAALGGMNGDSDVSLVSAGSDAGLANAVSEWRYRQRLAELGKEQDKARNASADYGAGRAFYS